MIINNSNLLTNFVMKLTSSISSGNFSQMLAQSFGESFGQMILSLLAKAVYFVCKWIMYFLDIIFFYIRQLSGMNVDTSSLSALSSGDSDMVFKMLYSNSNLVIQILRQLIGLAIAVIVILAIIGVIKTIYDSSKKGEPAKVTEVVKDALKALLMIVLIPAISVGGIMMSNIILKSLYNATNVTGATSLGSSIFSISSSSGNLFRIYAQTGDRIPIYYEFSQQETILDEIENQEELNTKSIEYLTSADNPAYQTHLMFENSTHYKFDEIDNDSAISNAYYSYYDIPADNDESIYKRLRAYREEYLVMADVIDYAVKTSSVLYYKTIEEVIDSAKNIPGYTYEDLLGFSVGNDDSYDIFKNTGQGVITFSSNLFEYDELSMEPGVPKQIQYNHVIGSTDELYGAVFVVTLETTIVDKNGKTHTYYKPFTSGYRKDNYSSPFTSDFISNGNIVVAKGLFTSENLPTAIRREKNGTDIQFYRDTLKEYDLGDIAGIAMIYPNDEEQNNIFTSIAKIFQTIFNPKSLLPEFLLNEDAVKTTYRRETQQVAALSEGRLHISYLFDYSDSFKNSIYTMNVYNFYNIEKFNFLILIAGSWLLLKCCGMAVFSLVKRIYEVFLLILFYPTACATLPLDKGAGLKKWLGSFTAKLFSAYGLILGINFILFAVPIIETVQFFSVSEIATTTVTRRIGLLLCNIVSYSQMARILNLTVAVLFELVAFSMLQDNGIIKLMSNFFPGQEDVTANNAMQELMTTVQKIQNVVSKVGGPAIWAVGAITNPKKAIVDAAGKAGGALKRIVPGSALYEDVMNKGFQFKKKLEQGKAMFDMIQGFKSGSASPEQMQKLMNSFMKAQESYTKSLGDGVKNQRKAEKAKKKEEKAEDDKSFMQNSKNDGDESETMGIFDDYSDKEIEKLMKDASKFTEKSRGYKKLKKKFGADVANKKLAEAQRITENGQKVIDARNMTDSEYNANQDKIKELENKKAMGNLTPEEEAELQDLQGMLGLYQHEKNNAASGFNHNMSARKSRKYREKKEKREAKDAEVFSRKSRGITALRQKSRIKKYDKEISEIESDLKANSDMEKYSGMSIAELNKVINDSENGLNPEQRAMIKRYYDALNYKKKMLDINDQEYQKIAANSARNKNRKQENLLVSRFNPIKGIRKRIHGAVVGGRDVDRYEAELEAITQQLEADKQNVGDIDAKAYKERRKLNERKQWLEARIQESKFWNENNNADSIKAMRKKKKFNKSRYHKTLVQYAINYLQSKGKSITQENIDKYIANYERGKSNK